MLMLSSCSYSISYFSAVPGSTMSRKVLYINFCEHSAHVRPVCVLLAITTPVLECSVLDAFRCRRCRPPCVTDVQFDVMLCAARCVGACFKIVYVAGLSCF